MKVCKACFAHVWDLKRLRGHLTYEAALMAANALVGSRLDYCNSLFRGLSALDLGNFNVFRTVLPESLLTPPSINTSLQLEKHYIGC